VQHKRTERNNNEMHDAIYKKGETSLQEYSFIWLFSSNIYNVNVTLKNRRKKSSLGNELNAIT